MMLLGKGGSAAGCKGHIHMFGSGSADGFYALSPPVPSTGGKALILGVPLNFMEVVQPTTTLDDKRVLYLFGSAWNEISVSGILLLGDADSKGAQLGALMGWYNQNRVSKLRGPVSVSLGSSAIDAYVVGLRLDQANPEINTQMFSIQMVTADT